MLWAATAACWLAPVLACVAATRYGELTPIPLWAASLVFTEDSAANATAPTYISYDKLPLCPPTHKEYLGRPADRLVRTPYTIDFAKTLPPRLLCLKTLHRDQIQYLSSLIQRKAHIPLFFDGLPVTVPLGHVGLAPSAKDDANPLVELNDSDTVYIMPHYNFLIEYNVDQIVSIRVAPQNPFPLPNLNPHDPGYTNPASLDPITVRFSYTVRWQATKFPYSERMFRSSHPQSEADMEIDWRSVANASLSMLLLATFFATVMLRLVRTDFAESSASPEHFGWKILHAEVFRPPTHPKFLAAALGAGTQLVALCTGALVVGSVHIVYPVSRQTLIVVATVLYSVTAAMAGMVSADVYAVIIADLPNQPNRWISVSLLTALVFTGPVIVMVTPLNALSAWSARTDGATPIAAAATLPSWAVVAAIVLWVAVSLPMTVVGSALGRNRQRYRLLGSVNPHLQGPGSPTAGRSPRALPRTPWHRNLASLAVIAGAVPFSSIYLELVHVFGALWGYKVVATYHVLAFVFAILLAVVTISTVSAVYFQLIVEDYRWWWSSFLFGGAVGVYTLVFSLLYYYARAPLEGPVQGVLFLGWMSIASYALFLMCGSVGFFAAQHFVSYLFVSLKSE